WCFTHYQNRGDSPTIALKRSARRSECRHENASKTTVQHMLVLVGGCLNRQEASGKGTQVLTPNGRPAPARLEKSHRFRRASREAQCLVCPTPDIHGLMPQDRLGQTPPREMA